MAVPADARSGARVWDWPTRAFHWLLAAAVVFSWVTGKFELVDLQIHFYSGYLVIGLLVFRIVWGFTGSGPSRFSAFVSGPSRVVAYAKSVGRRSPSCWPGHNPLGGWSVIALLLALLAMVAAGLFSDDEVLYQGALAPFVGEDARAIASEIHEVLSSIVLLLVVLHLGAIGFYAYWKRENLVRAMVSGTRDDLEPDALPRPLLGPVALVARAVPAVLVAAAAAALVVNAYGLFGG